MAILATGNSFSTGDQVTAATLNAAVNSATFASGAVDGTTTQISGTAIIVKDGGITSAKLDTNIQVAGTLGVTGAFTGTSTVSATGSFYVPNNGIFAFGTIGATDTFIAGNDSTNAISATVAGTAIWSAATTGLSITGTLDSSGGAWFGTAALATSATTGHVYIQTCAGTPTGIPASKTGQVALQFDTTNNKLYVYDGAWLATAALS